MPIQRRYVPNFGHGTTHGLVFLGIAWLLCCCARSPQKRRGVASRTIAGLLRQLCLCAPHRSAYIPCCITRAMQRWLTGSPSGDQNPALSAVESNRC